MIAGLSRTITLYLSPLLAIAAIVLSLLAFLAPTLVLQDQVALLVVLPSTLLSQSGPSQSVDGPSVFLGVLGSCARAKNDAPLNCTLPSLSTAYNLSVLPNSAPRLLLSPPTAATPVFIAVALGFSAMFLISFTLISFREKMPGKVGAVFERPAVQRASALIGFFGFIIGLTAFLIVRMWFGKAAQDFNATIAALGPQGPKITADTGSAFTMIWVAYAFLAIPIIISLTKLNVRLTKS